MGLDMYLYRVNKNADPYNRNTKKTEVCYWRKDNNIHTWFIRELMLPKAFNCEMAKVERNVLVKFIGVATEILSCETLDKKIEMAKTLMPTTDGFFWGSTEYDERYFKSLKETVVEFGAILRCVDFNKQSLYYSCWW